MAGEANAAITAAFDAGAHEVVVNDSHWTMRNLRAEDLDPRARLIVGDKPLSMTQGIGEDGDGAFDAACFVGYHAGAGHPTGVIAHTYSSATIMEVRVNGVPHNEAGLNAIRLGHHGVPVALVAGDDRARRGGRAAPSLGRASRREARARLLARRLAEPGGRAPGHRRRRPTRARPARRAAGVRADAADLGRGRLPIPGPRGIRRGPSGRRALGSAHRADRGRDGDVAFRRFLATAIAWPPPQPSDRHGRDRATPAARPDGAFATGVSVVAARHGPLLAGMTANAIARSASIRRS